MTFVGKILVVVQLVLSVCFMAFAGAVFTVQTNWKTASEKSQQSYRDLQNANNQLSEEFETFKANTAKLVLGPEGQVMEIEKRLLETPEVGLDEQLATATARVTTLTRDLEAIRNELANTQAQRDNALAEVDVAKQEATARRLEAEEQRERNSKLHASLDKVITELRNLEDENFTRGRLLTELNKVFKEKQEQLREAEEVIARNQYDRGVIFSEEPAPPPIVRGVVKEARQTTNRNAQFVQISIGSDDGLVVGHELHVYRPAEQNNGRPKYLGKIELVRVTTDSAVGIVVERAKNGVIEANDRVTSYLDSLL